MWFYSLPCSCDEDGSTGQNCTSVGEVQQCYCNEGRGGPTCNQCAPGYYTSSILNQNLKIFT